MTSPLLPVAGPALPLFLAASLVLAVTPGPAVLYIVARSLSQGRRAGLASVAGVAIGNLGNALGASIGLAAVFAASASAFTLVKLAGAAYLVVLGITALRRPAAAAPGDLGGAVRLPRVFRDGFLVALLNPKTAIFFAAFLPQFIEPGASTIVQSALLGAVFVAIAAATDTIYVLASGFAATRLVGSARTRAAARYATAATYIGLGVFTAATGARSTR